MQPGLFDVVTTPRANPVKREIDRLNAAAERVLERLRIGPATNVQLSVPEIGGLAAIRRVWDLKQRGYRIGKEHVHKGVWLYRLIG